MKPNVLQREKLASPAGEDTITGTKLAFMSLGCAKALVDSEKVLGKVLEAGMVLTDDPGAAEVIVVNTCGFLKSAEEESLEAIREAVAYKEQGECRHVVALGCLAERRGGEIEEQVPGVDAVIGVKKRDKLAFAVNKLLSGLKRKDLVLTGGDEKCNRDVARFRLTQNHFGYIKVGEGCDNTCTFCVIPDIRGGLRSKPLEDIRAEAEEMAADGAREINVIGQDTTDYGRDLYGKRRLGEALETIADVDGIDWVRLLYAYPGHLQEDVLDVMENHPDVVPYIDVPVQHIAKRVLKRMSRGTTQKQVISLLSKLRSRIPNIAIRTTLIVGFPGEGEEEFEELKQFVREWEFERLGVFEYSDEDHAPSNRLDEKVDPEEISRRRDELMELQKEIAFRQAEDRIGQQVPVLLEKDAPDQDWMVGRTHWDAPEQDPVMYVKSADGFQEGDLILAEITGTQGYDLKGTAIEEYSDSSDRS